MKHKDILIGIILVLCMQLSIGETEWSASKLQSDTFSPRQAYGSENFQKHSNSERAHYRWQDGDQTILLWEDEDLVMERYDGGEQSSAIAAQDVLASYGELRIVKKQSWHQLGDDVFPVLVSANGTWKALPGGVIVVLSPKMRQAEIDAFFAKMDLNQVSKMNFTKNAYLIETGPGIVSLELSNKLTGMDEVMLSSPNWLDAVELR